MIINFFEHTNKYLPHLTESEQQIFNYIVKNIHDVKDMSIRTLSNKCYTSTTTMFRFVRKIGFSGYSEFISVLKITELHMGEPAIPKVFWQKEYSEEYLKNVMETVRVLNKDQIKDFNHLLDQKPTIYLLGEGLSSEVVKYAHHLLTSLGFMAILPREDYEIHTLYSKVKDEDMIFIFSFTGENEKIIRIVEHISFECKPTIVSITRAGNNMIQNMSDLNFYVFSDQVSYGGLDLTSRISMIAVLEMLLYSRLKEATETMCTEK